MADLTLTTNLTFNGKLEKPLDLRTARDPISIISNSTLSDGTSANQGNEVWIDQRILAATSENLDIVDGTLFNAFGDGITLSLMKILWIRNLNTTSGADLLLSGNAMPLTGTTPKITVEPGGEFFWKSPVDGKAVTGTTADTLTIDSASATITFDILIAGVT